MDSWITISLILFVGIVLIVAEVILVPGTTLIGILGVIITGMGIYYTFQRYGAGTGYAVLFGSVVLSVVVLIVGFRSGTWNRFALHESSQGKVNEEFVPEVEVGDIGVTVSSLRPYGKAEFNDKLVEVSTLGQFVRSGLQVKVVDKKSNRIFVEPLTS